MKKPSEIERLEIKKSWIVLFAIGMMFFGKLLVCDEHAKEYFEKNTNGSFDHETIHLKQAVSTKNSFWVYYLKYIWKYLKNIGLIFYGFDMPYYMNPFEMEAYAFELESEHARQEKCEDWKVFDKMTWKEKKETAKAFKAYVGKRSLFFKAVYDALVAEN